MVDRRNRVPARNFNSRIAPFAPRTGKYLAMHRQFQVLTITQVFEDYLLCGSKKVAKPWLLRTSPFDDQEFDGISYNYTGVSARTATSGEVTESQLITPSYVVGEELVVLHNLDEAFSLVDSDGDTAAHGRYCRRKSSGRIQPKIISRAVLSLATRCARYRYR